MRHRQLLVSALIGAAIIDGTAQAAPGPAAPLPLPAGVRHIPDVVFRQQGSDTIRMDLFVPSAPTPKPAIVFVGGGAGVHRTEQLGFHAVQLASKGFVSAIVDYAPCVIGTRPPISATVADATLAVRWLRANAQLHAIDRARIGMVGAGEGGLVAALAGLPNWFGVGSNDNVAFPAEVAAVAVLEPLLDLADSTLAKPARDALDSVLATRAPAQRPDGLEIDVPYRERISPTNYFGGGLTRDVRAHVPPFLFLHGTADAFAPLRHSETLAGELRKHGYAAEIWPVTGSRLAS